MKHNSTESYANWLAVRTWNVHQLCNSWVKIITYVLNNSRFI